MKSPKSNYRFKLNFCVPYKKKKSIESEGQHPFPFKHASLLRPIVISQRPFRKENFVKIYTTDCMYSILKFHHCESVLAISSFLQKISYKNMPPKAADPL